MNDPEIHKAVEYLESLGYEVKMVMQVPNNVVVFSVGGHQMSDGDVIKLAATARTRHAIDNPTLAS